MDASSRILNELAQHERALDEKLAQARAAAERDIEAAKAQAARILQDAQDRASTLSREHASSLEREVGEIANVGEQSHHQASEGQMGKAVEAILRAVLP